jgi:hypothetical protein
MRKLLTFFFALAVTVGISVGAFAQILPGPGLPVSSGTFTPASIPGLIAWYKADNDGTNVFTDTGCSSSATNNSLVACWKDKSGNGYNCFQSTSADRPTYLTAGLGGNPTIEFIASSLTGCISAAGVVFGTGVSASGFFAGTMTSSASSFANAMNYCGPSSSACNSSGDVNFAFRDNSTDALCPGKGAISGAGCPSISLSTLIRFGSVANGSTLTPYLNGVAGTAGSGSDNAANSGCVSIGNGAANCVYNGNGFNSWDGAISEIVIYNTALTPTQISQLDAYFTSRW